MVFEYKMKKFFCVKSHFDFFNIVKTSSKLCKKMARLLSTSFDSIYNSTKLALRIMFHNVFNFPLIL
jgi:predicted transcriptional regulator